MLSPHPKHAATGSDATEEHHEVLYNSQTNLFEGIRPYVFTARHLQSETPKPQERSSRSEPLVSLTPNATTSGSEVEAGGCAGDLIFFSDLDLFELENTSWVR